ncbi:hypothetical protein BYT27DRAFT_7212358 [Phlegmacium glaucopus]|nr:hypothetical protein BYT27DRAFT_7212358 [Phlegmacium glaucopus]
MAPTIPGTSDRERLSAHAEVLALQEQLSLSYKDAAHRLYMAELERMKSDERMYKAFANLQAFTEYTLGSAYDQRWWTLGPTPGHSAQLPVIRLDCRSSKLGQGSADMSGNTGISRICALPMPVIHMGHQVPKVMMALEFRLVTTALIFVVFDCRSSKGARKRPNDMADPPSTGFDAPPIWMADGWHTHSKCARHQAHGMADYTSSRNSLPGGPMVPDGSLTNTGCRSSAAFQGQGNRLTVPR